MLTLWSLVVVVRSVGFGCVASFSLHCKSLKRQRRDNRRNKKKYISGMAMRQGGFVDHKNTPEGTRRLADCNIAIK
jgi:hypothetical protein